jgi:transcriptional regulator with XRE-family HTH domain
MSNFGSKLAELLERNNLRAAQLSRVTNINDALISRWINGRQTFINRKDLANICNVISQAPKEQAELILAHLLDERGTGPGSQLVKISIDGSAPAAEPVPQYSTVLPLKIHRALTLIGTESLTDPDIRSLIMSVAKLCEPKANAEKAPADLANAVIVSTALDAATSPKPEPRPVSIPTGKASSRSRKPSPI